jgi:hypothetical protein
MSVLVILYQWLGIKGLNRFSSANSSKNLLRLGMSSQLTAGLCTIRLPENVVSGEENHTPQWEHET